MKVVVDLEATCFENSNLRPKMETIEIGAVFTDDTFAALATWSVLVKPVIVPELSDFCKQLTHISQEEVDGGLGFSAAMDAFNAFALLRFEKPLSRMQFCSWGNFDLNLLLRDSAFHGIPYIMGKHVNLKDEFAVKRGRRPCGLRKALASMHLEFEGQHHRALPDALNIARLAEKAGM